MSRSSEMRPHVMYLGIPAGTVPAPISTTSSHVPTYFTIPPVMLPTQLQPCVGYTAAASSTDVHNTQERVGLRRAPRRVIATTSELDIAWRRSIETQLKAGDTSAALATLRPFVRQLSFDHVGCRLVQDALTVAKKKEAADLVAELAGCIKQAVESPHANYVIQQAITELHSSSLGTMLDELRLVAPDLSYHKFGCRIMCRLVEHGLTHPTGAAIIEVAFRDVKNLCLHNFGRRVIETILEHGLPDQKRLIAGVLRDNIDIYATHKYGSRMIEKAWEWCSADDRETLADAVLRHPGGVVSLAEDRFGWYVVRTLVRLRCKSACLARRVLHEESHRLRTSHFGRGVLEQLDLRVVEELGDA